MAHVVSLVHRSLEAAQDARGHCLLLAAYVQYAFRLPGTEPSLPSGKCWWEGPGGQDVSGRKASQSEGTACAKAWRPYRSWLVWAACKRESFCSLLPSPPDWWSLLLDWWVIQPVNKHLP